MSGILTAGGFRFRRLGLATLFAGAAFLLALESAAPEAAAKGGKPALKTDLVLGAAGEGSDAEGRMTLKQGRRGDRLKIRLRNLEPRTNYEIVDDATDAVLKTVRTNRRGNAKTTLRSAPPPRRNRAAVESNLPETLEGISLDIRRVGDDEPVLEGDAPGEGEENGTWYKFGSVCSEPDAAVQVSITMNSWHEPGMGAPFDQVCLSVSSGLFWIAEEGGDPANGGGDGTVVPDIFPLPDMPEVPTIPGPVSFWIRGEGGELEQVASVEAQGCDEYEPLPGMMDGFGGNSVSTFGGFPSNGFGLPDGTTFPGFGDDGDDGQNGDDGGDGTTCPFPCPSYFSWCADSTSEGGLPLGLGSVEGLSNREFEVRDGEGNVLLSGVLPQLEKVDLEPTPLPEPWPDTIPDLDKIRELLNGLGIEIDINIDISVLLGLAGGFSWSYPGVNTGE
jgi:hypothetical protein